MCDEALVILSFHNSACVYSNFFLKYFLTSGVGEGWTLEDGEVKAWPFTAAHPPMQTFNFLFDLLFALYALQPAGSAWIWYENTTSTNFKGHQVYFEHHLDSNGRNCDVFLGSFTVKKVWIFESVSARDSEMIHSGSVVGAVRLLQHLLSRYLILNIHVWTADCTCRCVDPK